MNVLKLSEHMRNLGIIALVVGAASGAFKTSPYIANLPIDLTLIAFAVTTGIVASILLMRDHLSVSRGVILPLWLLLAMLPGLIWVQGSAYSIEKATIFFTISAACIIGPVVLIRATNDVRILLQGILLVGVVLAITAFLGLTSNEPQSRVGAFDGSVLHAAKWAGTAAVGCIVWATSRRSHSLFAAAVAFVSVVAVIATGTRAAAIGVVGSTLVVLAVQHGQGRGRIARLMFAVPVLATATLYSLSAVPGRSRSRVEEAFRDLSGTFEENIRLEAVSDSVGLIIARPLGVGLGRWPEYSGTPLAYPHNLVFEVGAEAGWAAMLLISLYLAVAARCAWRYSDKIYGQILLGILLFLVIQSLSSGDINSQRLLYVVASSCIMLPYVRASGSVSGHSLDRTYFGGSESSRLLP